MRHKGAMLFRVLMNRYHQGPSEAFLEPISKDYAQTILEQPISSADPTPILLSHEQLVDEKIHYSWFVPVLETFSKSLQPLLVSSFPPDKAEALSRHMKILLFTHLSEASKHFFLMLFYQKFQFQAALPLAFLPESPLGELVRLTKAQLIELIDFLGLYDLAEEIRQIVDKTLLQAVYACLSAKKQHFLRACLYKKEKLKGEKIELLNWKGDKAQLERILHHRGIIRLSYALRGQNADFVWHIVHRLDVGRGHLVEKHFSRKELPGVTAFLAQQVLNTLNFLQRTSDWGRSR